MKYFTGNPLALEVDVRQKVTINGIKQWIYLAGAHKDNPVILWLDGVPGGGRQAVIIQTRIP
ncbi:MAG: hypothetical protein WBI82_00545 [Sphaerochaeta sp.]